MRSDQINFRTILVDPKILDFRSDPYYNNT